MIPKAPMRTMAYPANFPCPSQNGYGVDVNWESADVMMQDGWTRRRRVHPYTYRRFSLTFSMSTQIFHQWHDWVYREGFDWFQINLQSDRQDRTSQDTIQHTIRFISSASYNYRNFNSVTVVMNAELLRDPVLDLEPGVTFP